MPSAISTPLTYEILMYLNSFYFGMFATCELCMGIYKAANLPSPGTNKLLIEFALLLFLLSTEAGRIYLGRKGNLMERGLLFLLAIALTVPSSFVTLYFLLWQHYTLRLEVILCSIQIALLTSELIIAVLCLVSIYRPSTEE
ncbi:transmembrane protein 216-like [Leptopilina heterotoma]|uniref:transmembrane protein 216-like n=1 Tax=Leptopilina heterotoma TaxID=63436 RepID=UPI001CA7B716|nr:transmembrane protein 216-like [Leptopilina heterotoma]